MAQAAIADALKRRTLLKMAIHVVAFRATFSHLFMRPESALRGDSAGSTQMRDVPVKHQRVLRLLRKTAGLEKGGALIAGGRCGSCPKSFYTPQPLNPKP